MNDFVCINALIKLINTWSAEKVYSYCMLINNIGAESLKVCDN